MRQLFSLVSFILAVFAILPFISLSSAASVSELGEPCRFTGECAEGYCINSICDYPDIIEYYSITGNCSSSDDCRSGFCVEGRCVLPARDELRLFSLKVKSGCAGVLDRCTPDTCFLCDMIWISLLVLSAMAAFDSRHKGLALPLVLSVLPLMFGIIAFPLLGFLLAVTEVFILMLLNGRR